MEIKDLRKNNEQKRRFHYGDIVTFENNPNFYMLVATTDNTAALLNIKNGNVLKTGSCSSNSKELFKTLASLSGDFEYPELVHVNATVE